MKKMTQKKSSQQKNIRYPSFMQYLAEIGKLLKKAFQFFPIAFMNKDYDETIVGRFLMDDELKKFENNCSFDALNKAIETYVSDSPISLATHCIQKELQMKCNIYGDISVNHITILKDSDDRYSVNKIAKELVSNNLYILKDIISDNVDIAIKSTYHTFFKIRTSILQFTIIVRLDTMLENKHHGRLTHLKKSAVKDILNKHCDEAFIGTLNQFDALKSLTGIKGEIRFC